MKLKTSLNVKILGTWGELVEQVGNMMYEDTEPLEQLVQLLQNDKNSPYSLLIEKPCGCTIAFTSIDMTGTTCQKHDSYYITWED